MTPLLKAATAVAAIVCMAGPSVAETLRGTLYKNPSCTCCEGHAAYLKEHGIEVEIQVSEDLAAINAEAGMPEEYEGCHTIMLNGYAIEGHVSAEIIDKLIRDRPADVVGISLPGMPTGVPGMGGEKDEPYDVYAIHKDGSVTVYATE